MKLRGLRSGVLLPLGADLGLPTGEKRGETEPVVTIGEAISTTGVLGGWGESVWPSFHVPVKMALA
jgi:hypothetical protein